MWTVYEYGRFQSRIQGKREGRMREEKGKKKWELH